MDAVKIERLTKSFTKGHAALRDVSLRVGSGEMVALIGASGSGKSTLIRHVSGLIQADRSAGDCRVEVLGRTVQENGQIFGNVANIRRQVGVIFQQFNLVGRSSVLTNVLAGLLGQISPWRGPLGLFTNEEKRSAMKALTRVGIAEMALRRAESLSGGQQQRAAIARALVQEAKLILADEPVASLDPASAKRVMEILRQINGEDGITVLVSLHQVEYARRYCRRTIAMRAGEIVFDGSSRELTIDSLREIYGEASDELILPDASVGEVLDDLVPQPVLATA